MIWDRVGELLLDRVEQQDPPSSASALDDGQRRSLRQIAARLPRGGVIIADEVGMGKTRIAATLARGVIDAGGRVAFLLPPGLGAQWSQELSNVGLPNAPEILRSLAGFLDAWATIDGIPWHQQRAVSISHVFANWKLGAAAASWRWALLPLCVAEWRHRRGERRPPGYRTLIETLRERANLLCAAAITLLEHSLGSLEQDSRERLATLFDEIDWKSACEPVNYGQFSDHRRCLESLIGVGLGTFDLLIIDEAHKGRGESSGLSRLLEMVIGSGQVRRVALTATPIELDVDQWTQMLDRVQAGHFTDKTMGICRSYADALETVRLTWRTSEPNRLKFRQAAQDFQDLIGQYVLRRDKREDPLIQKFLALKPGSLDGYRHESPIEIKPDTLTPAWLDIIFAAEGLSAIRHSRYAVNANTDRLLRLTVGNGHGLCAIVDSFSAQAQSDGGDGGACKPPEDLMHPRATYWRSVLLDSLRRSGLSGESRNTSVLYEHPSIAAAVRLIEELTNLGRKVLVFGKFTLPMKALEEILNARRMLMHLKDGKEWHQSGIAEDHHRAVSAGLHQLHMDGSWTLATVSARLKSGYLALEMKRRTSMLRVRRVLEEEAFGLRLDALSALNRAVVELAGATLDEVPDRDLVTLAREVIRSLSDDDDIGDSSDNRDDDTRRTLATHEVGCRIVDEYSGPVGGYARRMSGDTSPHARRALQLRFNRKECYPYVLIAQSQVGREGLNLHMQCRDVVLFHPEWNPAVVEQQIGRVDRLGSRWCRDFQHWLDTGASGDPPRIEIRPIMFMGTYDEHNWRVLKDRWQQLRGQLHGIVISEHELHGATPEQVALAREVNDWAPRLSPR